MSTKAACGHYTHDYWDCNGEEGIRMGAIDPFGYSVRFEPCPEPEPPGRAPSEPPIGTVVRDRTGQLSQRYERGWGPTPLGNVIPWARWRPMWETWGPLVVVDSPAEASLSASATE